jgi:hypothetical protein
LNTEDLTACAGSKDNPMHWFRLIIVAVVYLLNQLTLDFHTYVAGNLRKIEMQATPVKDTLPRSRRNALLHLSRILENKDQ